MVMTWNSMLRSVLLPNDSLIFFIIKTERPPHLLGAATRRGGPIIVIPDSELRVRGLWIPWVEGL